jgi:predicted transcriptional regulator
MAVISLRLNQKEEKMVNYLSDHYQQDKSSLIKYSLKELYEDIIDKKTIGEYESLEETGKIKFIDSEEIIKKIKKAKTST